MNILSVDNITKAYGERKLFDKASFFLQEGEKAGIIGINGTGKSSLLKMIAGIDEPDEGEIVRALGMVVGFLPQHPVFEAEETVLDAVLAETAPEDIWSKENEAKAMMTRLGITDFHEKCGHLSGGQKKRLALIRVLLSKADLLILDEPTNHLDGQMADWLEETLKKRKSAVVMVTHDRYFLDNVSTRIIEIDKGQIYSYQTNYSGYLELKMSREESALATERKRQSILRTELEWVQRGARARSTKQKARLERYEELKSRKAPVTDAAVELGSVASRMGKTTIELHDISKGYEDKVLFRHFSYIFLKNDRVGFVGKNGCGKTTLMKLINEEILPDEGFIEVGTTIKIGYYAQECNMPAHKRVIDYIKDVAEIIDTPEGKVTASKMLEKFLFSGEDQYGLIGKLSGGEKRRLHLCRVLMGAPNVLILDEPTNDLDIATLTILESYLDTFQGIVITVSHDRYFLDRIVRRIFAFEENGQIVQYEGGYTDYSLKKSAVEEEQETAQAKKAAGVSKVNVQQTQKGQRTRGPQKLKFTYQEQKDYETIESDIAALEEKIEKLENEMAAVSTDFVKLNQIVADKEAAESLLEEKMDRWMYLEELAAKIAKQ